MRKTYKGAVFFDVDGTLIAESTNQIPTEKTVKALELLKKNGYMVGIATGRAKCYVPNFGIDFNCYVTSNGACVDVDGERIWNKCFSKEELAELTQTMDEIGISYILESPEACRYNESAIEDVKFLVGEFGIDRQSFSNIKDLKDLCVKNPDGLNVNKLNIIYGEIEKFDKLLMRLGDKYNISKHRHSCSADVNALGMNKSLGILKAAESFNIPIDNVYAFGDGRNDFEMLSAAGQGVAMGDHASCLEEIPGVMITDTVKNDGIYKALKELKLIV